MKWNKAWKLLLQLTLAHTVRHHSWWLSHVKTHGEQKPPQYVIRDVAADLVVSVLSTVMQIRVLIYFEGEGNLQEVACRKPHPRFTMFKSNCFNQRLFITRLIELPKRTFFLYTYNPFILLALRTIKKDSKDERNKKNDRTNSSEPQSMSKQN